MASSLAITINSIINQKYKNTLWFSKSLFIDEYTQVLRSITSGWLRTHSRHKTEQKLAELINQANFTYLADADFNQVALQFI